MILTLAQAHELTILHTQLFDDDYVIEQAGTTALALTHTVQSLNWAIKSVALACGTYSERVALTLQTNVSTYNYQLGTDTAKRMFTIDAVAIDNVPLRKRDRRTIGTWTYQEFLQGNPGYADEGAARPAVAVLMPDNMTLMLFPKPDQVYTDCWVSGPSLPTQFTDADGATVLPLPVSVHEAVPLLAAYRRARPFCTEEDAWKRMAEINSEWPREAARLKAQHDYARAVAATPYRVRVV